MTFYNGSSTEGPRNVSVMANGWPKPGRRTTTAYPAKSEPERSSLVWISCSRSVVGLERILEKDFRVHRGEEPPKDGVPSSVVLFANNAKGLPERIKRAQEPNPGAPVLVFGPNIDLSLARTALNAGARGFLHGEMTPDQIAQAIKVALKGEIVAPRKLLEYLISDEPTVDPHLLSPRQREILDFVVEGLSNAQIARRIFLSKSTVKQHLRAAYKILGVKNRTEASRLLRNQ